MPDAKRPDPKRRSPASRPGTGKGGEAKGRPRGSSAARRERATEPRKAPVPDVVAELAEPSGPSGAEDADDNGIIGPLKKSIAEAAEQQSEQRLGSAARRAAILAAVVCVLTLTIAGPVRTYFAQRTEMQQLATAETQLRAQITDLEEQKVKLADPVYIAAQARERLGFVMPGEIPYQVQLPVTAGPAALPGTDAAHVPSGQPWYTSLWHTIADAPHGVSPTPSPVAPPVVPPPPVAPPGPAPGG
jgi:cell division protein FtsB